MGGEDTGVTETTRNVLLESAYFLPASVRRTARELNLPSDASYRFERGVDPGMILRASQRATQLIREIAGGQPAIETITAGTLPAPPPGCRSPLRALRRAARRLCRASGGGSDSRRFRSAKAGRDGRAIKLAHSQLSFRSSPRSGSDRRESCGSSESTASRRRIAAGSRPLRQRIAATISKCSCGSAWSRAVFRKRAPRR